MKDKRFYQIPYTPHLGYLNQVEFVTKREFGPSDIDNAAYIRVEADRSAKNMFRDGDFIVGRYLFVADITGCDSHRVVNDLCDHIEAFSGGVARWTDIGTDSETIYNNETSDLLKQECEYTAIWFELKTPHKCY